MRVADFQQIKFAAHGMLDPLVYRRIAELAAHAHGDILEIGTAHGAATIAAALGAPSRHRIVTIDRFVGGLCGRYGDVDANVRLVRENFANFGVSEKIDLLVSDVADAASTLPDDQKFGMMIIDADGAIDRDLSLFYDRLSPAAPIVIDDYGSRRVRVVWRRWRQVAVDQKHRLTADLVDYFESKGYIKRNYIVGETWFGQKSATTSTADFDYMELMKIYRSMTFATGSLNVGSYYKLSRWMKLKTPQIHHGLKKAFGRTLN
jgi:precorrin-6B methylase 2